VVYRYKHSAFANLRAIRSALSLLRHSKFNEFGLKPVVVIVLREGGGADSFCKCSFGTLEGKKCTRILPK
jgi:hypothetical protein